MVEGVCVDPGEVDRAWPSVRDFVRWALTEDEFADVESNVKAGRFLLWLAIEDRTHVKGAVVTELYTEEGEKFCGILACGGSDMPQWKHLLSRIEQFARDEHCKAIRLNARRLGWIRALPDYRVHRVILEKEV